MACTGCRAGPTRPTPASPSVRGRRSLAAAGGAVPERAYSWGRGCPRSTRQRSILSWGGERTCGTAAAFRSSFDRIVLPGTPPPSSLHCTARLACCCCCCRGNAVSLSSLFGISVLAYPAALWIGLFECVPRQTGSSCDHRSSRWVSFSTTGRMDIFSHAREHG
jgi:hypothetical protein